MSTQQSLHNDKDTERQVNWVYYGSKAQVHRGKALKFPQPIRNVLEISFQPWLNTWESKRHPSPFPGNRPEQRALIAGEAPHMLTVLQHLETEGTNGIRKATQT